MVSALEYRNGHMATDRQWSYREGTYIVRPIDPSTFEDFGRFTELMEAAWAVNDQALEDLNLIPFHVFEGQSKQGNLLGTFTEDGDRLVAFAHFVAPIEGPGEERTVYSHVVAVHPEFQDSGIGRIQKRGQAAYLAEKGYRGMHWTFDPNESRNARFNYRVLGCTSTEFVRNKYPELPGLPADRLICCMEFHTDRFEQAMETGSVEGEYTDPRHEFVLNADCSVDFEASSVSPTGDWEYAVDGRPTSSDRPVVVDNPRTFDSIAEDAIRREIHFARRALFERLLSTPASEGSYVVVDYLKKGESPGDHPAYVLVPSGSVESP